MHRALRRSVVASLIAVAVVIPAASVGAEEGDSSAAEASSAIALGWVPLGGPYVVDPTALAASNVVFSLLGGLSDVGGEPAYHEWNGSSWSGPVPLGGYLTSIVAPAEPLVEPPQANWEIFGVGPFEDVYYRTRNSSWQGLGGLIQSSPTAVRWNGTAYVFGVGADDAVWYRSPTTGWQSLGGRVYSDLAVTTDGTNLFVLGLAADGSLWTQRLSGSTWSGWQSLGGNVGSYPTATYANGVGYVFVTGADDAVWYRAVSGGNWGGWTTLGGFALSAPAPVARTGGVDVFVVGGDLAMYSQRASGGGWSGWRADGGGFISNPAASSSFVFGIGFDEQIWAAGLP